MPINAFADDIPALFEIVQEHVVRDYIQRTLLRIFDLMDVVDAGQLSLDVMLRAAASNEQEQYEQKMHEWLMHPLRLTPHKIAHAFTGRSQLIYTQIKPYIIDSSVLDLGCGDGQVGAHIARAGLDVTLADIYRNPHLPKGFPFVGLPAAPDALPISDNTLLLTVLHHSDDPLQTLNLAKARTRKGGRIIIIESVYGISPEVEEAGDGAINTLICTDLKTLTSQQQRRAGIFFDHFYNRVLHYNKDPQKKVNVPYNFRTQPLWSEIFKAEGLTLLRTEHLGIDQAVVPEYHVLYILEA